MEQLFAYAVVGVLALMGLSIAILFVAACGLATFALVSYLMWGR